jgi:hypothetical protein
MFDGQAEVLTQKAIHNALADPGIAAARKGQFLLLQYQAARPHWSLSGGRSVPAEVAAILTTTLPPSSAATAPSIGQCQAAC